jgi:cephalosporin hydroxylase
MGMGKAIRRALARVAGGVDDATLRELARQWTRGAWQRNLWQGNTWLGFPILQWPTDMMVVQEIIFQQRPRIIVETGTHRGGSTVYYASLLRLIGDGRVVSVDVEIPDAVRAAIAASPLADRIVLVQGDSKAPEVVARVRDVAAGESNVLVVLDSDHSRAHVLAELRAYCDLAPVGGYLIAMDTICSDLWDLPNGVRAWQDDNALRAVEDFLREHPEFEVDRSCEKFLVTFSPGGFLRRRC